MKEKRLNPGSDSDERIGILPTDELYIDREIIGDCTREHTLTEYLTAPEVARLKSLLALRSFATVPQKLKQNPGVWSADD